MKTQAVPKRKKSPATGANEPFASLRNILKKHSRNLSVLVDKPGVYTVETRTVLHRGKPLWAGCVRQGKNYTSYHLIAVYAFPDLLKNISPELKRRMQGKACFNFTKVDEKLFDELAKLTAAGFEKFKTTKLPEWKRDSGV
jgi:hypothetical protein